MERDAGRKRGTRPFIFTNLKGGTGLDAVLDWVEQQLKLPTEQRRTIIDAHAHYVGRPHSHDHDHHGHDPLEVGVERN
jgi:hypothetical protein